MKAFIIFVIFALLLLQAACFTFERKTTMKPSATAPGGYEQSNWVPHITANGKIIDTSGNQTYIQGYYPIPIETGTVATGTATPSDIERTSSYSEDKNGIMPRLREVLTPEYKPKAEEKKEPNQQPEPTRMDDSPAI